MTHISAPTQAVEQAEAILQVFQAAPHPLTVPQAEKLYSGPKLKKNELRQIVETQLLMQGQLFRCSPSGKNARYWIHDEEEKVREAAEEVLGKGPLAESKLATAINKALPKISSPAAIKTYIQNMRREGLVHEWPGKTPLLSLHPYDPLSAITLTKATLKSLSAVLAQVESLGGSMAEFLELIRRNMRGSTEQTRPQTPSSPQQHATSPPRQQEGGTQQATDQQSPQIEIEALILKGMHDLNSAVDEGATVLVRDLRRQMPPEFQSHETFDQAVIHLAEQERIVLHRHDQITFLTETEREELVRDSNGTYFTAIAQRV